MLSLCCMGWVPILTIPPSNLASSFLLLRIALSRFSKVASTYHENKTKNKNIKFQKILNKENCQAHQVACKKNINNCLKQFLIK